MRNVYNFMTVLFFCTVNSVTGQMIPSPGGTTNTVEFWLKADEIQQGSVISNNASVNLWENRSDKMINFVRNGLRPTPRYSHTNGMNFHPAVNFTKVTAAGNITSLVSDSNFTTVPGRTYLSFYVVSSKENLNSNISNGALFNYRNDHDEGFYGDTQANYLYTSNSTGNTNNGGGLGTKRTGIISFHRPAGTTSAISNSFVLHNAKQSNVTLRNIVAGNNGTAGTAVIGTRNATSPALGTSFFGGIQEIIILSSTTAFNNPADIQNIQNINSYLAIKYGQTLDTLGQPNLYNSAGNPVWSLSANRGYNNNVFGIARDDATGLYQKQSKNADDDALTVFLGPNLYTLNTQNGQTLNRGVYLLLGSNALNGTAPYVYPAGTAFENTTSTETFANRQARIYKAQLTNESSLTVSLQVKKFKAKYVLVSASSSFTPTAATRIYPITDGKAVGVQIRNGDFIGFVLDGITPGGINAYGIELWLKSDRLIEDALPDENAQVTRWANHSGLMLDFVRNGSNTTPRYSYSGMNYHPSVYFPKVDNNAQISSLVSENDFTTTNGRYYLSFYVSSRGDLSSNTSNGVLLNYRGNSNQDEGWYGNTQNGYLYTMNSGGTAYFSGGLYPQANGIVSFLRPAATVATAVPANVRHNATTLTGGNVRPLMAGSGTAVIGTRMMASPAVATSFFGNIQEVIVLSAPSNSFTAADIARINTYLAVKYGQMLDTIQHPQWVQSDGTTVIWDKANHPNFNHNIFGIGRDDATGLYQKQSMSTNSSEKITVFAGTGSKPERLNSQNSSELSNGFFLMFGSNGLVSRNDNRVWYEYGTDQPFLGGDTTTLKLEYRHATILQAQITGAASCTANFSPGGLYADYVLVSTDSTFQPANTRIYAVDDNFSASNVLINNGDYVGFAYHLKKPGGVGNSLVMWLKADEPSTLDVLYNGDVGQWRDFSGNPLNVFYHKGTTDVHLLPGFKPIDNDMNFHPALDFRYHSGNDGSLSNKEYLVTERAPFTAPLTNATNPNHYGNASNQPDYWTIVSVVRLREFPWNEKWSYFIGFGGTSPSDAPTVGATRHPAIGYRSNNGKNFPRLYQEDGTSGSGNGEYTGLERDFYNTVSSTITIFSRFQNTASPNSYFQFEANANVERNFYGNSTTYNGGIAGRNDHRNVFNNAQRMAQGGTLGNASLPYRQLVGSMAEVIAFQTILPDADKDKLYSYLALKYGMTLEKKYYQNIVPYTPVPNSKFDYYLSDGTTPVWLGTTQPYGSYHHNIAAIVRDDDANLNNLQAHSTEAGSSILMGIGKRLGDNAVLTGLNTNKEFIVWGNNGRPFTRTLYPPDECGKSEEYLSGRIWMVEAGTQQNYSVQIGAGSQGFDDGNYSFPYNSAGWDVYLLMADSESKILNRQWDRVIPGVWVNGVLNSTLTKGLHIFDVILEQGQTCYFTFGGTKKVGGCESCSVDNRFLPVKFTSGSAGTWPDGRRDADFLLNSRGFTANISTGFDLPGNAHFSPSSYPRAVGGTLLMRRAGNAQQIMRTVINLDSAAVTSFDLRGISRYDSRYSNVRVYGKCSDGSSDEILPDLSYVMPKNNSSYTIELNGYAKARKTGSYTSRNSWMYVDFDNPVKQIIIEQNAYGSDARPGYMYFALGGPINFACPAPPPPVNEDGLSFSQQASPREVSLCKEVTYTWRIQNTHCDPKYVNFSVTLPDSMRWLHSSLIIDDDNITGATNINSYDGTKTLTIDSLLLTGSSTTVFRARAYFHVNALPDDYTGRAKIKYEKSVNSIFVPDSLESCDRMTSGCAPTTVTALSAGSRENSLEISSLTLDKSCYSAGDTLTATITVNNPNLKPISQAALFVDYNEAFRYQLNSLNTLLAVGTPNLYDDGGGFALEGPSGTGFTVPTGTHTISFQIIAPTTLVQDIDADGNPLFDAHGYPLYPPLYLSINFGSLSDYECADEAFREAWKDVEVAHKPNVRIDGPTTTCTGGTSWLSHWIGGTWISKDPAIATIDQRADSAIIHAVLPGKTVFQYLLPSGCIAESDTFTVDGWVWAANDRIRKKATLNTVQDNGMYENPVSVLFRDTIEYEIKVVNAGPSSGAVTMRDTLPPYLNYASASLRAYKEGSSVSGDIETVTKTSVPPSPERDIITWGLTNMQSLDSVFVAFKATPEKGVNASQPMFINKAWIHIKNDTVLTTNSTYHQGMGVSVMTFSHAIGGRIYNAQAQILDYRTSARSGVLVVPDDGYQFVGWSHDAYTSLRGEQIPAADGIMRYDTLIVYGDIHLQANFRYSGHEDITSTPAFSDEDKIWTYKNELHIHTTKSGSIAKIYTLDGILRRLHTFISAGETKIKLEPGIYIVTLNNGTGKKVMINN